MRGFKGVSYNISGSLYGRVDAVKRDAFGESYLVTCADDGGHAYVRSGSLLEGVFLKRSWYTVECMHLSAGDVICLSGDGRLVVEYSAGSRDNVFCVTDRCNHRCIMCPQHVVISGSAVDRYEECCSIARLVEDSHPHVGITGGEPLIAPDRFVGLVETCLDSDANWSFQVLTNATACAEYQLVKQLAGYLKGRAVFCVPIYSDSASVHDQIVGSPGGLWKAALGVHHLACEGIDTEIRTVLLQHNIHRLRSLAEFICKNFPFVGHVALMGQEMIANARINMDKVWVEPSEYSGALVDAVELLDDSRINVSIYNIPLCMLPERLWKYASRSISEWKVVHAEKCSECKVSDECCGIFFSNLKYVERYVVPIRS